MNAFPSLPEGDFGLEGRQGPAPKLTSSGMSAAVRVQAGLAIPASVSEIEGADLAAYGLRTGAFSRAAAGAPRMLLRVPKDGAACFSVGPWDPDPSFLSGRGPLPSSLCVLIDLEEGACADIALSSARSLSDEASGAAIGVRAGKGSRLRLSARLSAQQGQASWAQIGAVLASGASMGLCSFLDSDGLLRLGSEIELADGSILQERSFAALRPKARAERASSVARAKTARADSLLRALSSSGSTLGWSFEDAPRADTPRADTSKAIQSAALCEAILFGEGGRVRALPDLDSPSQRRAFKTSRLDEASLLLLAQRGIEPAKAMAMLVRAFGSSMFEDAAALAAFLPPAHLRRAPVEDVLHRLVGALDARLSDFTAR